MKNYLLVLWIIFLTFWGHAQSRIQRIHNYSTLSGFYSSGIAGQLPDDSLIFITGGAGDPLINANHSFIATLDYSLNVVHSKILYSSGNRSGSLVSGENDRIIKTGPDRYLTWGMNQQLTLNDSFLVSKSFLYVFNSALDSLGLYKDNDSLRVSRINAVVKDRQTNILSLEVTTSDIYRNPYSPGLFQADSAWLTITKRDDHLNQLWSRNYFPSNEQLNSNAPEKIILAHDSSSFIFTVALVAYNQAGLDPRAQQTFCKIDSAGNLIWHDTLPIVRPLTQVTDFDIIALKGGGYGFVSDYGDSVVNGIAYVYGSVWGKIDEAGHIVWMKDFRYSQNNAWTATGIRLREAENGDMLLLYEDWNNGNNQVLRTDSLGNIKALRNYTYNGCTGNENTLWGLNILPDKRWLLSGWVSGSIAQNCTDSSGVFSWYILTDTFGCMNPGCQLADTVWQHHATGVGVVPALSDVRVFPNPAGSEVFISTGSDAEDLQAIIVDMAGRRLLVRKLEKNAIEALPLSACPPGIYMVELWQGRAKLRTVRLSHR